MASERREDNGALLGLFLLWASTEDENIGRTRVEANLTTSYGCRGFGLFVDAGLCRITSHMHTVLGNDGQPESTPVVPGSMPAGRSVGRGKETKDQTPGETEGAGAGVGGSDSPVKVMPRVAPGFFPLPLRSPTFHRRRKVRSTRAPNRRSPFGVGVEKDTER